ncbi:EKC/KEOPS complex subunit LAGE3 [Lepus europaeus]|uniref:EKC/KEOPS complex subunit LAGE3 n=1 Tax=Lepus europaeus TaxID=9983 RepID=UPI002B4A1A57|nr:EKC/KEOPS complex subunit LAGE3 [Lepus europaeus]
MQAADAGAGSVAGGAHTQRGRRGRDFPDGTDTEAAAAGGTREVAQAPHAAIPGGDAATAAANPGMRPHSFTLSVPFPTRLEAEIACESLAPDAEPHPEAIGKDLAVTGTVLAVRWTAKDPRLLRVSIINFLEQLSLVVRTLQRFGPPIAR